MKKNLLLTILSSSCLFVNAQNKQIGNSRLMSSVGFENFQRTPTDTLYWTNTAASPTFINSQGGGYVCGINGYGDKAKVQGFELAATPSGGSPITVEEVIIWFGAKINTNQDTVNSAVKVNVYYLNGPGTSSAGSVNTAPNTILSTVSVPVNDLDTGSTLAEGGNIIAFGAPVWVGGNFGVGIDFTSVLPGDTIGMVSSSDGDAGQTELAWEKFSTNAWHTMLQSWPLDIDFAIWPIIDNAPQGVNEAILNGVSITQNMPNPASSVTTINYQIVDNAKNVTIHILDSNGKLVTKFNEGAKTAGKYSISLDVSNYASGNYYYTIQADGKRMGRKMQVTK
jgi:hypothetical protein